MCPAQWCCVNPQDFIQYTSAFLAAEKILLGADQVPSWRTVYDSERQRLKLPLEINGEQKGESLIIDACPDDSPPKFREIVICRPWFLGRTTTHGPTIVISSNASTEQGKSNSGTPSPYPRICAQLTLRYAGFVGRTMFKLASL